LLLGKNDLHTGSVMSVRDGMVHDANGSDDFPSFLDLVQVQDIAGVTDDQRSLSFFSSASDAHDLASAEEDFINLGVEHVGSTMDSTESTEGLRQTT